MGEAKHCRYCGAEIPAGEAFCAKCGKPVKRPLGVLLITVASVTMGVLNLLGGAAGGVAYALFGEVVVNGIIRGFAGLFLVLAEIIIGVFLLVRSVGLWKLTQWGWWLAIITSIIYISNSIYSLVIGAFTTAEATQPIMLELRIMGYLAMKRMYFGIKYVLRRN